MELQKYDKVRISDGMFSEESIRYMSGHVPTEGRVLRVNKKTYSIGYLTPNGRGGEHEGHLLVPKDCNGIERI